MNPITAKKLQSYAALNLNAANEYAKKGTDTLSMLECLGGWTAYLEIYDWLEDLTLPQILVRLEAKYQRLYNRYADDSIQEARCYGALNSIEYVKANLGTEFQE